MAVCPITSWQLVLWQLQHVQSTPGIASATLAYIDGCESINDAQWGQLVTQLKVGVVCLPLVALHCARLHF